MKKITVQEWVNEIGIKKAAAATDVDTSTARNWARGFVLPNSFRMFLILAATKGRVSLDLSVQKHWAEGNAKNRYKATA